MENKGGNVHTLPNDISVKVNLIAQVQFKLTTMLAVQHVSHYTIGTSPLPIFIGGSLVKLFFFIHIFFLDSTCFSSQISVERPKVFSLILK